MPGSTSASSDNISANFLGSSDPEFEDYQRQFTIVEQGADKLIKDTKAFSEAVLCTNAISHSWSNR